MFFITWERDDVINSNDYITYSYHKYSKYIDKLPPLDCIYIYIYMYIYISPSNNQSTCIFCIKFVIYYFYFCVYIKGFKNSFIAQVLLEDYVIAW